MNDKNTISIILSIVLLVVVGIFLLAVIGDDDVQVDTNDQQNDVMNDSGDGSQSPPAGFRLYENDDLGFGILYREDMLVEQETGQRIKFSLFGPDSEPNTEITDGFTLTIYNDPTQEEYDSLRAYAEQRLSEKQNVTDGLELREVNNMSAYRFSYESMLGPVVTEYVFFAEGSGYIATYNVSDPNNRGYESIVLSMLESIRLYPDSLAEFDSVNLAFLDYRDMGPESDGVERGCDRVVFVSREIEPTAAPLTAAMNKLFGIEEEMVDGWHNFMARTNDTLSFDRATVDDGVASIYLTGELSELAGVCDNPRASIQIEETALQFSTVQDVEIYLNGEQTDLIPSGRGE